MAERYLYRVRPGRLFGARKDIVEGDAIELTEAEASPFLDKLERVEADDEPRTDERASDGPLFHSLSSKHLIALQEAGFFTDELIQEASDDELLAVDGIGPAALTQIRGLYEAE